MADPPVQETVTRALLLHESNVVCVVWRATSPHCTSSYIIRVRFDRARDEEDVLS